MGLKLFSIQFWVVDFFAGDCLLLYIFYIIRVIKVNIVNEVIILTSRSKDCWNSRTPVVVMYLLENRRIIRVVKATRAIRVVKI